MCFILEKAINVVILKNVDRRLDAWVLFGYSSGAPLSRSNTSKRSDLVNRRNTGSSNESRNSSITALSRGYLVSELRQVKSLSTISRAKSKTICLLVIVNNIVKRLGIRFKQSSCDIRSRIVFKFTWIVLDLACRRMKRLMHYVVVEGRYVACIHVIRAIGIEIWLFVASIVY